MTQKAPRTPQKRRPTATTKTLPRRTKRAPTTPEPIVRRYYVQHPPHGDLSPEELAAWTPTVMEYSLPFDVWFTLGSRERVFRETKNPVLILEAFLVAHRARLYPPLWALDALADGFTRYHETGDPEAFSLDKALGLRPGQGKSLPLKSLIEEARDEMVTLDLFRLTVFGYTADIAAEMVARRLAREPWDLSGLKVGNLSAVSIKDRYYRKWRRLWNSGEHKAALLSWTTEKRADFLKRFPPVLSDYPSK